MSRPLKSKSFEEVMAFVAQGVINLTEGHELSPESVIHAAMGELCCRVTDGEVGVLKEPVTLFPTREELHADVRQLYWRYRDTKMPATDFAELLLIKLHEAGVLAPGYKPDGLPHQRSWPKED